MEKGFCIVGLVLMALAAFSIPFGPGVSAQGAVSPCDPYGSPLVRVAITGSPFPSLKLDHEEILATAPGGLKVEERGSGRLLFTTGPHEVIRIAAEPGGLRLMLLPGQGGFSAQSAGSVVISSLEPESPIGLPGLLRPGVKPYPSYRGFFEVYPSDRPGKFRLINVVPLEDYLRSVVGTEMPQSFEREALRAQAVAARSYTVYNWGKHGPDGANLCDSSHCQVYLGVAGENAQASLACEDTRGLFALYGEEVINAVYSSTAGGYTEDSRNVWTGSEGGLPYLKGVPDDPGVRPPLTEEEARGFILSSRGRFDRVSPHFRWVEEWSREELEAILNETLAKRSSSSPGAVDPPFPPGSTIGRLINLEVTRRGTSGRATALQITGSLGAWRVSGELEIRQVLRPNRGGSLKSANVVFELVRDDGGNLTRIVAYGAGMGHGVGMSQWGANGMARTGYSFAEILSHYYSGVTVETLPVNIQGSMGKDVMHLEASIPSGRGSLILRRLELEELAFRINDEYRITLKLAAFRGKILELDISEYLQQGLNVVEFEVGDLRGSALVSLRVSS